MNPTVFRFVKAIEKFAKEKGLEVDYRNNIEEQYIDLFFRDSICKHHQSRALVYFTEIFHNDDSLEAFANRIVDMAVRAIGGLKKEEGFKMYISPGRSGGKTLIQNALHDLSTPELKQVHEFLKKRLNIDKENNMNHPFYIIHKNSIKDVIFNPPATIVMWKDGTKTVVKAQNDETFDPEKGLAMAIAKKALGNQGNYFETIKKYTEPYKKEKTNE